MEAYEAKLMSQDGSKIYYPHTVSDLVYDNKTGKTVKEQIDTLCENVDETNANVDSIYALVNGEGSKQEEVINILSYESVNAYPLNGNWMASPSYKGRFIPCKKGRTYVLSAGTEKGSYMFVKSNDVVSGEPVPFAEGWNDAKAVLAGQNAEVPVPSDAQYLWVCAVRAKVECDLASVKIKEQHGDADGSILSTLAKHEKALTTLAEKVDGYDDSIEDINGVLYGSDEPEENIDILQYPSESAFISGSATWLVSVSYKARFIPCGAGKTYKITNGDTKTYYCFLRSKDVVSGSSVQFADGYTNSVSINANASIEVVAPPNATYLFVTSLVANSPCDVASIVKKASGKNGIVGKVESLANLSDSFESIAESVSGMEDKLGSKGSTEDLDAADANNGYFNTVYNKVLATTDGRKLSQPMLLKVGDSIEVYSPAMGTNYGVVVKSSSANIEDASFELKVKGNGVSGYQTYNYTVEEEGYYLIGWEGTHYSEAYARVTKIGQDYIAQIKKQISDLSEEVANKEPQSPTMSAPAIRKYQRTKLPTISIIFDDCLDADEDAVTLFKRYGIRCSFAFIASESNIASKAKRYLRYQNEGFSILSHSVDSVIFDKTNYPTAVDAYNALRDSRKRLEDAGIKCNGFVAPSSTFVTDYIPMLETIYSYAFTGLGDSSIKISSQRCNLSRHSIESLPFDDETSNCLKGKINIAKTFGYNMTFYAHNRGMSGTGIGAREWNYTKLETFIAYLVSEMNSGNIIVDNTDVCFDNFYDADRALQDGYIGGKKLKFNDDNTVSWE